jgi:serine/threonine-protein kinase ULK2
MEGIVLKKEYNFLKELGSGSFGKVYLVEDPKSKHTRAMKLINKKKLDKYLHQAFWKELEVMRKCECENSVKLIEHFKDSECYYILIELCDEDLENVLNKRERGFTEEEVRILLKQLNNVFAIMEKENIIHRDLKLKNIMVVYNKLNEINLLTDQNIQKHSLNFTAKLSDFGFSKIMEDDSTFSRVGTPITMAPEVLKNEKYTIKADLWSIGIITYQLLFKTLPEGRNAMQRSVKKFITSGS